MSGATSDAAAARRTGLVHGLSAYVLWGLLPIYFMFVEEVRPTEIVAHRILWSVALLGVLIVARRKTADFVGVIRQPRLIGALSLSASLIAANWLVYIYAIQTDHVIAASLGYFLNPLVNVAIGVLALKERLRPVQMIAIGLAAVGVAILLAGELSTLWISITLAMSFASYGLVRKLTPVDPINGLAVETLILVLPAAAMLPILATQAPLAFGNDAPATIVLLASGAITAVPLMLFASAARRVSMISLGLMQYIAPSLQFLLGIFLFHEVMSGERWATFALIWSALALFAWDSLRASRAAASPGAA